MGFKNLYQKFFSKNEKQNKDNDHETKLFFENEVKKIAKRYSHNQDIKIEDDKNILFADFYPDQYNQWLNTRALADRRVVIYGLLDKILWNKLQLWEKAESLIESRLPLKAYELLDKNKPDDSENMEMYYSIFAKVNIIMGEYDKALLQIIKGLNNFPDSKNLKMQLADYYYSISSAEKYNEVINELVNGIKPNDSKDMNIIFEHFFNYIDGQLRSVGFAINLGFSLADPEQIKIFWKKASDEFYYHPAFRLDHARYILENRKKDDTVYIAEAFLKYFYLLEEMPWQKEAAVNALSLAELLDIKDEKYDFIKNIIDKNGWDNKA